MQLYTYFAKFMGEINVVMRTIYQRHSTRRLVKFNQDRGHRLANHFLVEVTKDVLLKFSRKILIFEQGFKLFFISTICGNFDSYFMALPDYHGLSPPDWSMT